MGQRQGLQRQGPLSTPRLCPCHLGQGLPRSVPFLLSPTPSSLTFFSDERYPPPPSASSSRDYLPPRGPPATASPLTPIPPPSPGLPLGGGGGVGPRGQSQSYPRIRPRSMSPRRPLPPPSSSYVPLPDPPLRRSRLDYQDYYPPFRRGPLPPSAVSPTDRISSPHRNLGGPGDYYRGMGLRR